MPAIEISRTMLVNQGLSALSGLTRSPDDSDGAAVGSVDTVASLKRLVVDDAISVLDHDLVATIVALDSPLDMATYFINAKYAELGGADGMLGTTTSAIVASGAGFVRTFQRGAIYFLAQVGAHELHGPVRVRWQELGGDKSFLGFPTSDVTPGADVRSEGVFAHFQGGSIYWAPPPRTVGALSETVATGMLTATMLTPAAVSSPATVTGAATTVARRAASVEMDLSAGAAGVATKPAGGGASAVTGAAKIDALTGAGIGIIKPTVETSAGAFEVHGAIREKYLALGAEASILGYPRTDETATPDGIGRFNHFQGGSIYWTPGTFAHEVHGLIRDRWASLGWERNPQLGYPISDELIPDRRIGHRRPEVRKKPIVAIPNDVIKLPAEAALAGFPSTVVNTPLAAAKAPDMAVTPQKATTVVMPAGGSALGKLSEKTDTAIVQAGTVRLDPGVVGVVVGPGPASTAADARSVNRFSDFENGVLFWFRGATSASTLGPLATTSDGTSVSFSGADIAAAAIAKIGRATFEGSNSRVASLSFVGTTGYSFDGVQTHNRRHRLQVILTGIENMPFPVPVTATVEIQVEVWFDASQRQIALTPTDWTLMQASSGSYAAAVSAVLRARLDSLLWTSYELLTLPETDGGAPIAVLAVKTLANGAVAVFVEPRPNLVLGNITEIANGVIPAVVLFSQPN